MSIQAKQLRPYLKGMKISPEAKEQLAAALATKESFIIYPPGELADEMRKGPSCCPAYSARFRCHRTPERGNCPERVLSTTRDPGS